MVRNHRLSALPCLTDYKIVFSMIDRPLETGGSYPKNPRRYSRLMHRRHDTQGVAVFALRRIGNMHC
jgi:hypothetical protein